MGVDCAPDARHRVPRHAACRRRSCRVRRAGAPRPPHQRTGRRAEAHHPRLRELHAWFATSGRSAGRVPHLLRDARAPAGRARTHAPNGIARRRSDERRAARARRGGHSAGRGSRQHLQAARPQYAAVRASSDSSRKRWQSVETPQGGFRPAWDAEVPAPLDLTGVWVAEVRKRGMEPIGWRWTSR